MAIAMQLALDLGATLGELNQRMSAQEFALWSALHRQQPRGVERDNYHAALIASLMANINAPKGKRFSVQDFMFEDSDSKKQRQTQTFVSGLRALAQTKPNPKPKDKTP